MSNELMGELITYGLIVAMGLIFYFMIWRPQKNQESVRSTMLSNLKRGDQVVTIGGVHGTIVRLGDTTVGIEVSKGLELEFSRTAVNSVITKE